jgi:hypothetical protein
MQLVLLKGFGTSVTGLSETLDFLRTCSDGLDGFSGLDFLTGLDGFGFSGSSFGLDWLVFLDSGIFNLLLRSVFQDLVSVWFFQWFGTVGFFRIWSVQGIKEKMKLTDIGLWIFDGYWTKNFRVSGYWL